MPTSEDIKNLFAEFPKEDIHWRAQNLNREGTSALALAYIDARDVMERLDQVCGAPDWQDRYEVHGGRVICYLSIRVNDEWITKADGAGDTQVEAEKGGLSDAFKRAAVKWGIGRYLYDLEAPWVPCESYKATRNGREVNVRKKWTADPWSFVKGAAKASAAAMKRGLEEIDNDLLDCASVPAVNQCAKEWNTRMNAEGWTASYREQAIPKFQAARERLKEAA
jgi:hypothetical protein